MSERQVGDYVLGEVIGRGGQGRVFRAKHRRTGATVALKLVGLGSDDEAGERLARRVERESEALKKMQHMAMVSVQDVGRHRVSETDNPENPLGYVYIAYDFIEGVDLGEALENASVDAIGIEELGSDMVTMFRTLGDCLDILHSKQLIHRDIKPTNIMLRNGDLADPVIIDFTLVKVEGRSTLTGSGGGLGTYGYAAPELSIRGASVGAPSDQWSLAVVAARTIAILLGADQLGLTDLSGSQTLDESEFDDLMTVKRVLQKALAKAPEDRYAAVADFVHNLVEALIVDEVVDDEGPTQGEVQGGALTGSMARSELVKLRREIWNEHSAGAPDAHGILRQRMLDAFITFRITNQEDMNVRMNPAYLAKTDTSQLKHLGKIFAITERIEKEE